MEKSIVKGKYVHNMMFQIRTDQIQEETGKEAKDLNQQCRGHLIIYFKEKTGATTLFKQNSK